VITRAASGVPLSTMAVLMASVFTVSIGYGVVLPLLPYLIERLLGNGADAAQVSRSTGLPTGLYTLALFLVVGTARNPADPAPTRLRANGQTDGWPARISLQTRELLACAPHARAL
jgi:hypothetical protein